MSRSCLVPILVGLVFLASGCGASSNSAKPGDSTYPTVDQEDSESTADPAVRQSQEGRRVEAQPPTPPPPPPTPRLVLGHPTVRGKVLFAEELIPVLEAVEKKLMADSGVVVVGSKQVLLEREIVRSGKLPSGKACERIPDPLNVSQGLHQAQVAQTTIVCDELNCVLSIHAPSVGFKRSLVLSAGSEDLIAIWASEILANDWSDTPTPVVEEITPELGKVRSPYLVPSNVQFPVEKDPAKPLQRAARLAHRCEKKSPSDDPSAQRYLLEIGASGRIDRCEADRPDLVVSNIHTCTCNALKRQVRYPKAKKGSPIRRTSMNLHVKAKDTDENRAKNSRVELQFSTSDDPIAHLGYSTIPVTKMARCADLVQEDTEVGIRLEIAGQGEHVAHSTRWVGDVPDSVKTCVKELVREVKMTCPANDRATVNGKMVLRAPN